MLRDGSANASYALLSIFAGNVHLKFTPKQITACISSEASENNFRNHIKKLLLWHVDLPFPYFL